MVGDKLLPFKLKKKSVNDNHWICLPTITENCVVHNEIKGHEI